MVHGENLHIILLQQHPNELCGAFGRPFCAFCSSSHTIVETRCLVSSVSSEVSGGHDPRRI